MSPRGVDVFAGNRSKASAGSFARVIFYRTSLGGRTRRSAPYDSNSLVTTNARVFSTTKITKLHEMYLKWVAPLACPTVNVKGFCYSKR
ncbi:hypothetical protein Enr17x_43690 [Gimesia fumaroli]|uniref:Uncharacterized protein n=1 Tax=Gimesia fumaroli TaxID=2527976 RepID=A0A518IGT8_9PLAN|nr:hypothetical protein Enr17x_43690 [Gimesia fumaroli]